MRDLDEERLGEVERNAQHFDIGATADATRRMVAEIRRRRAKDNIAVPAPTPAPIDRLLEAKMVRVVAPPGQSVAVYGALMGAARGALEMAVRDERGEVDVENAIEIMRSAMQAMPATSQRPPSTDPLPRLRCDDAAQDTDGAADARRECRACAGDGFLAADCHTAASERVTRDGKRCGYCGGTGRSSS
jgi:hypothetical protein